MTPKQKDQAWVESQRKKYRDASTGEYVTRECAEANPATTVGESDGLGQRELLMLKLLDQHEARIQTLEADVALLIDTIKRMGDVDRLIGAINAQQSSNQQLADSVGALAQCVAMVMEEELGTPVADDPAPVETDWDGNPVG